MTLCASPRNGRRWTPPPRASRVPSGDQLRPSSRLSRLLSGADDRLHHCPVGRDQKNLPAEYRRDQVRRWATTRPRPVLSEPRLIVQSTCPPAEKSDRSPWSRRTASRSPLGDQSLPGRKSSRELALGPRGDVENPEACASIGRAPPVVEDIARERDAGCRRPDQVGERSCSFCARRGRCSKVGGATRGRCGSARRTAFPSRLRACCHQAPNPCRRSCRGRASLKPPAGIAIPRDADAVRFKVPNRYGVGEVRKSDVANRAGEERRLRERRRPENCIIAKDAHPARTLARARSISFASCLERLSATGETRFPLLHERGQALFRVLVAKSSPKRRLRYRGFRRDRPGARRWSPFSPRRARAALSPPAARAVSIRLLHQLGRLEDAERVDAKSLGGVHRPAGEDQVLRDPDPQTRASRWSRPSPG